MGRSWYTPMVSRVIFPLHEALKGHDTFARLPVLEQTQWLPRDALDAIQSDRLHYLIERAATLVPYYRTLFAERGIDWRGIRTRDDLAQLPLLTKPLIRAAASRLVADGAARLERASTSGSTGEPLVFYLGPQRISHDVAARLRAIRWWGVNIGDPEVVLWSSPIETGRQSAARALRDHLIRSVFIDSRDLSDARVDTLIHRIEQADPSMIFGYSTAIARIALFALRQGRAVRTPSLKVVFVTAAKLLESQRWAIETVFKAPVANEYGGRDAGFVAHECPAGGMHISEEDIIVEAIGDRGESLPPGTTGEIVVTHLASQDYPFIRYRTGDRGSLSAEACPCGRSLAMLERIEGRTNDLLVAPGGRVVHHTAISNVLRDLPGLLNYKVIQEQPDRIRLLLVAAAKLPDSELERVRSVLLRHLSSEVRIVIEEVGDIPPEPTGKHRYIVSHIQGLA